MQDLLKFLLTPLVEDIKKVSIDEENQDGVKIFKISIPQKDIAKVIGKEGKMIKSIKNLLRIRSIKENTFTQIDLVEKM